MYKAFLIKYGEIGVKGKNRYLFEDALVRQIRFALKDVEGDFAVTKENGRIYATAKSDFDYDEAVEALQRVFGIVGICPVVQIEDKGFDDLANDEGVVDMTEIIGDIAKKDLAKVKKITLKYAPNEANTEYVLKEIKKQEEA